MGNGLKIEKSRVLKFSIFSACVCLALYAFAANRKVTIPPGEKGLELVNGSPVTVNYNVTCFNGSGGNTTFSGLSLSPRDSTNFSLGGSSTCLTGSNISFPTDFLNGMGHCGASTNFSGIGSVCPTGYHACSTSEYAAGFNSSFSPPCCGSNWFDSSSDYSGTWMFSTDGGATFNTTNTSGSRPSSTNNSSFICNKGTDTNNVNAAFNVPNCKADFTSSFGNVFCCPDFLAKSCEVEITNTPNDGYLQSPQFKGGSPF